ncbi:MAG: hypothetical protein QXW94_01395 [Desulfurococcaceae archaeon]
MYIPSSALYVKGSLSNTEGGFKFTLKNTLIDATILGPISLVVDGKSVEQGKIKVISQGKEIANSEISAANPTVFYINMPVEVIVEGAKLEPGEHVIVVETPTVYGVVKFEIKDQVIP